MKAFIGLILLLLLVGCGEKGIVDQGEIEQDKEAHEVEIMAFMMTSTAFTDEGMIPSKYTCDGGDTSPPLKIANIPQGTATLALICDDPDAPVGTWDHWVVFNIPSTTTEIAEGTEPSGTAGKNSWGRTGYGGPCPPSGVHRYYFKLYALDTMLELPEGATKQEVEAAMNSHILGEAVLMGKYTRGQLHKN